MYPSHDWSIAEQDGVADVIDQAARKVARHMELDVDDLVQEARILVCDLSTNLPECVYTADLGLLQYRLEQDLGDLSRREVRYQNRTESYEERNQALAEGEGYSYEQGVVAIRHDVSSYTRELVEALIPAIWDEDFCYGARTENAPDPDMPRTATNKSTGNTLAAHIADIRSTWSSAPLTPDERAAIFLCIYLDWTQEDAAIDQQVSQQAISGRLYRGVGRLVGTLNGDEALLDSLDDESDLAVAA